MFDENKMYTNKLYKIFESWSTSVKQPRWYNISVNLKTKKTLKLPNATSYVYGSQTID